MTNLPLITPWATVDAIEAQGPGPFSVPLPFDAGDMTGRWRRTSKAGYRIELDLDHITLVTVQEGVGHAVRLAARDEGERQLVALKGFASAADAAAAGLHHIFRVVLPGLYAVEGGPMADAAEIDPADLDKVLGDDDAWFQANNRSWRLRRTTKTELVLAGVEPRHRTVIVYRFTKGRHVRFYGIPTEGLEDADGRALRRAVKKHLPGVLEQSAAVLTTNSSATSASVVNPRS